MRLKYFSGSVPCQTYRPEPDVHNKENKCETDQAKKQLSKPDKLSLNLKAPASSEHHSMP